jgi:hypothetical protein
LYQKNRSLCFKLRRNGSFHWEQEIELVTFRHLFNKSSNLDGFENYSPADFESAGEHANESIN